MAPPPDGLLCEEEPLFAAGGDFVRTQGGGLGRAFVELLARRGWAPARVVFDSELVWVRTGETSGFREYHREPYLGERGGAYDAANAQEDVVFASVYFGSVALEFAIPVEGAPPPPATPRGRHLWVREMMDSGLATVIRPPPGLVVQHGRDTFVRRLDADRPGFSLILRGALDARWPVVNAPRNIVLAG